jgi:putative ABC transport system permease protein
MGTAMLSTLREAWRPFQRRPVLSVSVILTLALGQAVSASLFAILDGVLLKSLPFREPAGLFVVGPHSQLRPDRPTTVRPDDLEGFTRHPLARGAFGVCEGLGFFDSEYAAAEGLRDASLTTGFFAVLGVMPAIGRPLGPLDAVKTEPRPAVISYALWRNRFGSDTAVLGKPVVLGNRHVAIVGVMPAGFDFPRGTNVWLADVPNRTMAYLTAVVRAAPEDGPRLSMSTGREVCVAVPLRKYLDPGGTSGVIALFLATAITVVMAWVHLGGLQMAQALDRAREMATRLALGARSSQLVRQWLVETGALCGIAFLGAVAALPGLLALFIRLLPPEMSVGQPIAIDWRTLGFLGTLTVVGSGALVLGPMAVLRQKRLGDILHGGLPALGSASVARARWVLLAGQVALLTAVLYVAGLAVLSLERLNRTDVGFDTTNLFQVDLPPSVSAAAAQATFASVRERVSTLPFVVGVARGSLPLLAGRMPVSILPTAPQRTEDLETREGLEWWVSRGYFRTLGAHIVEGRDDEVESRADAALVSESVARLLRFGASAVGRRIYVSGSRHTIVGVVADLRAYGPEQPPTPYVYLPKIDAVPKLGGAMVVRTARAPEDVARAVVQAVREVTGERGPITMTLASTLEARATAGPRSRSVLLGVLALASLALGMVGIFSATNEAVRRRLRDTAVRMVLGADPWQVVREMVARTLAVVGVGLVAGLAAGTAAGLWASSLFVAVPTVRVGATCGVVLVLLVGSALAAFGPAYRAGRTDPLAVLRHE